ncbi:MAG: VanZ family protein [Thermodesulfobacteriota bacterium]
MENGAPQQAFKSENLQRTEADHPTLRHAILFDWTPVFLYCLMIFSFSSRPAPSQIPVFPYSDKIVHLLIYMIMGILFYRAFRREKDQTRTAIELAVSASILYGISDEIHQSFVPGRTAELSDVLADAFGSFFGVLLFHRFIRNRKNPDKVPV